MVSGTAPATQLPDPKVLDDARTLSAFFAGRHLAHSDAALSDFLALPPQSLRDDWLEVSLFEDKRILVQILDAFLLQKIVDL